MKKILAFVLALTVVMAMAACTPANNNETTGAAEVLPANALELLTTTWANIAEENKFPVMGGDEANINWEGPGSVVLPGAEGNALWNLNIPEDQLANFTEAATAIHAMNTNIFAGCAVKLTEGADKTAVAQAIADGIKGTHFMCGHPERLIVVSLGDYLVVAFGLDGVEEGNAKNITNFLTALQTAYATAKVLHDEPLV